jgi:hypothetical protein
MSKAFLWVPSLPTVNDPRAEPWLDLATDLALAFYRDLDPEDDSWLSIDTVIIHIAAAVAWHSTGGQPCWSRLDVDVWLQQLGSLPNWAQLQENAVMTLLAFYCFLVKFGHLTSEQAIGVVEQLEPYANPIIEQLGRTAFPTIDSVAGPN